MHRQKAVSRAYVVFLMLLCVLVIVALASLITGWRVLPSPTTGTLSLPSDGDIGRCLGEFDDDYLAEEADVVDSAGTTRRLSSRAASCGRSAALFDKLRACSDGGRRRRRLVNEARAAETCWFAEPPVECGRGNAKPRLLSYSGVAKVADTSASLRSRQLVPNLVHFVRFGNMSFDFQQYVTFLSVQKFQKPDAIFIHGDILPRESEYWWNKTIEDVNNIYHVYRPKPLTIFAKQISFIEHAADFARLQILIEYGGIYLDHDVILVKSMDPLRRYDVTLGREMPSLLANGVILARSNAQFLRIWLQTYRNYDSKSWSGHSTHIPHSLAIIFPHLLHIEERSLVRPNWSELQQLYYAVYPQWRLRNYCVHLYLQERHPGRVPANPEQLNSLRNTVAEVMNHVLYE